MTDDEFLDLIASRMIDNGRFSAGRPRDAGVDRADGPGIVDRAGGRRTLESVDLTAIRRVRQALDRLTLALEGDDESDEPTMH